MNGHDSRCRCDQCAVEKRIKILEERVEMLMSVYQCSLSAPINFPLNWGSVKATEMEVKSVPDPEFDWTRVDAELTSEVGPPKSVPPTMVNFIEVSFPKLVENAITKIEADRAQDEAYFKERAAGFRTVEIVADESWPDQPFVIGGES